MRKQSSRKKKVTYVGIVNFKSIARKDGIIL